MHGGERKSKRDGNLSLVVYCRALPLLVMTLMEEVGTRQHSSEGLKVSKVRSRDSWTILPVFKGNFFSTQRGQKQNPSLIVEMSLMSAESHIRSFGYRGTHHLPRGLEKSRLFKSRFSFMNLLGLPVNLIMAGNGACDSCSPMTRYGMDLLWEKEDVAHPCLQGLDLQLLLHRRPDPKPRKETSWCSF